MTAQLDANLAKLIAETRLDKPVADSLQGIFLPIYARASEAIKDAEGVAKSVKDATCVKEIKKSRACRLALRKIRLEGDAARSKEKESLLAHGRAIDGSYKILLAQISPIETALQEAEDIAARMEAERLAALKVKREEEIRPFLDGPMPSYLAELSEEDFQENLSGLKYARQARIDAIAKAEAEAKAKAKAERQERERIAAENARLKAEAIAREATVKAEREAAEAKARAEREAAEAAAAEERKRLQAIADEQREQLAAIKAAEAIAAKAKAPPIQHLGGGYDDCLSDQEAELADAVRACEIAKAEFEAARLKLAAAESHWRELAGIEEEGE